jgi:hypothetical protein
MPKSKQCLGPAGYPALSLPFGVLEASDAMRIRDRWAAFRNLRRLDVTGNAIASVAARALREVAPEVVELGHQRMWPNDEPYFTPPMVDFFDTWCATS